MNDENNLRVIAMQLTTRDNFLLPSDRIDAADKYYKYMSGDVSKNKNLYHPCTRILIEGLEKLNAHDVLREWDEARMKVDNLV
jgi:hypothetical protein